METNEMILNVIKSLISEEQIDEAIKAAVGERFSYTVNKAIEEHAHRIAAEYCDNKIIRILEEIFGSEVNVDDGFGMQKKYEKFEVYVKDYIKRKCSGGSYEMERNVRRMVDSRIEAICKEVVADNTADLANEAMRRLAGEKRK